MNTTIFLVSVIGLLVLIGTTTAVQKHWALLIAGSNTYMNYRHQADVCHAYQVLHTYGIPEERIVVMMFDDIAHSEENPFPGNIINQPNGPNVYPGVPKDYTGRNITVETFFAALQGQKDKIRQLTGKDRKVIESGPEDHIFVYYADHGAPGIVAIPGSEEQLKARNLNKVLKKMHSAKKFAQLTFYIEACESGSMFENLLPNDINVYATTAANSNESSYAFYFDKKRNTYLGDEYSIRWIQDTQKHDPHTESLETQYDRVKDQTKQSHVQQFGNLSMTSEFLSDFMSGMKKQVVGSFPFVEAPLDTDAIPSEIVPMMTLKNRIRNAASNSLLRSKLERELAMLEKRMTLTHTLFNNIATTVNRHVSFTQVFDQYMTHHEDIKNWDCYETAVDVLTGFCPGMKLTRNDYALRKLFVLVNLCNNKPMGPIIQAIETAASANPICAV